MDIDPSEMHRQTCLAANQINLVLSDISEACGRQTAYNALIATICASVELANEPELCMAEFLANLKYAWEQGRKAMKPPRDNIVSLVRNPAK